MDNFDPKICGIDEAGRGALAGPMSVCACVLKKDIVGLNDSKKLTPLKRKLLANKIELCSNYLIIFFSNTKIDKYGISRCMQLSLECFKSYFSGYELIFDGKTNYKSGVKTIIKADNKIASVAAASILAKVKRDELMCAYDKIYPQYGYAKHKGYGSRSHILAILKFGFSPISRYSFHIKELENSLFK